MIFQQTRKFHLWGVSRWNFSENSFGKSYTTSSFSFEKGSMWLLSTTIWLFRKIAPNFYYSSESIRIFTLLCRRKFNNLFLLSSIVIKQCIFKPIREGLYSPLCPWQQGLLCWQIRSFRNETIASIVLNNNERILFNLFSLFPSIIRYGVIHHASIIATKNRCFWQNVVR